MQTLTREEFERRFADAEVLVGGAAGPNVLRTPDGTIVKLFRAKGRTSSAGWWPYARRFAMRARRLAARGFPTVEVRELLHVRGLGRDAVVYASIEGRSIRAAAEAGAATPALGTAVARLFARLHDAGVYFRGLHFGNVIVDGDAVAGLVDVTDVRFRPFPLTVTARARNFKPFLRYPEDRAILEAWGAARFLADYEAVARLGRSGMARLGRRLAALDPLFRASHEAMP